MLTGSIDFNFKKSKTKFHENPSGRSEDVPRRHTDGRALRIAHLRQECHNSKFGIFELMV